MEFEEKVLEESKSEIEAEVEMVIARKKPLLKIIGLLVAMLCSVLIVLLGVLTVKGTFYESTSYLFSAGTADKNPTTTTYEYYGGDAYTGIQQAAADASNNAAIVAAEVDRANVTLQRVGDGIADGVKAILKAIGYMMISFGLGSICYFGVKMADCIQMEKKQI